MNLNDIVAEAKAAARQASAEYFEKVLGGQDRYACGFAWVSLYGYKGKRLDGRSKMAKMLKAAGVRQNWNRVFEIWNPADFGCQNVDTLEAGANAAAKVFQKYGFEAYAGSRLD